MSLKCHQCQMQFIESNMQFYRRLRNETMPICQECYRIQHAEERAKKRSDKLKKEIENMSTLAKMRKYKLTYEGALNFKGFK